MRRDLAIVARSMRAVTMPTPSPASASTSPHGSTISERPFAFHGPRFSRKINGQRADQQPNPCLLRNLAQGCKHRMVHLVTRLFAPQFADRLGETGVLRRHDEFGAAIARPTHEIRDDA